MDLLPIFGQALGHKQALPKRKLRSLEEFLKWFLEIKVLILGGTERPVQHPQDAQQQKEHYSGQKKRHTRKHSTSSTREKRVILLTILLTKVRPVRVHDKRNWMKRGWWLISPIRWQWRGIWDFKDCRMSLRTSICRIRSHEERS